MGDRGGQILYERPGRIRTTSPDLKHSQDRFLRERGFYFCSCACFQFPLKVRQLGHGMQKIEGVEFDDHLWIGAVRAAGVLHLVTLALACFTPIPPNWEETLARLPEVHRRFAAAQNASIGAVMVAFGLVCLLLAPLLVEGSTLARVICASIALWWGGRLVVLPWLGAHRYLPTRLLRMGFALLVSECILYFLGFGYLALR